MTPKDENAKEKAISCLEPTNLPSKRAIIQGIGLGITEKEVYIYKYIHICLLFID